MQRAHRFALGVLLAAVGAAAHAADAQPQPAAAPQGQATPADAAKGQAGDNKAGQAGRASDLSWSAPLQNKIAQCQGCHGIEGWRTAFPEVYHVPKLGGQKPEYIIAALKEYKSGERSFATMRAIASQLSEEDMQGIAKYYGAAGNATNTAESK
jgi:cytochrome c553